LPRPDLPIDENIYCVTTGAIGPARAVIAPPEPFNLIRAGSVIVKVVGLSLALAVVASIAPLSAQAVTQNFQLDIPRQPLGAALQDFARQTGLQIARLSDSVGGSAVVGPLNGEFSPEQALHTLLAASGLEFKVVNEHTIAVLDPAAIRLAAADTPAPAPSAAAASEPHAQLQEVVVTGSNIRVGLDAADSGALPVQVISSETFRATAGESIGDLLRSQPIVSGFNTTPANDEYNGGNTSINLRGLGDQYTLVLVNGRRFGGEDVPDIGALPSEAIESVEILKNGASAVFGSDAIAGVVNLKLKDRFDGVKLIGSYGNTTSHDASFRRAAALFGSSLGDFHFVGSLSWQDRNGMERQDRDISASRDFRPYGGLDRRSTSALIPNRITVPGLGSRSIDVSRFGPGSTSLDADDYVVPNASQRWSGNEIGTFPPYRRVSGHWLAEYEAVDRRLRLFAEGYYDKREQKFIYVAPQTIVHVPATNPYNPFGRDVTAYYQFGPNELPLLYSDYDTRNLQASAGIRGDLGERQYEVAFTRYHKTIDSKNYNDIVSDAAEAAVQRTDATALNVFGYWANTPQQLVGLTTTSELHVGNDVTSFEGRIAGPLFDLPTGAVAFALGAAHREVEYSYVPDEVWRTVDTYWSGLNPDIARGSRKVDSVYAEARVPLLRASDTGAINALELGGAARYEKYSDFGNATVGQVNARLALLDKSLTVRGSFAQAFKAPSVANLTAPQFESQLQGLIDPAFGGVAPVTVVEGGNPGLKPEKANTYDFGVVYAPRGGRLSLKADYWQIDLRDLIEEPNVQNVLFGTSPNGSLTRDPQTNQATVDARIDNGGDRTARGIDFGANYALEGGEVGRFTFGLDATHLLEFKTTLGNVVDDHLAGTSLGVIPKWRAVASTFWKLGGWESAFFLHYSEGVPDLFGTQPPRRTEDYWTGDLQLAYQFEGGEAALGGTLRDLQVHVGVENLWDTSIPFMNRFVDGYDRSIVDYRGRYVYVGIEKRL